MTYIKDINSLMSVQISFCHQMSYGQTFSVHTFEVSVLLGLYREIQLERWVGSMLWGMNAWQGSQLSSEADGTTLRITSHTQLFSNFWCLFWKYNCCFYYILLHEFFSLSFYFNVLICQSSPSSYSTTCNRIILNCNLTLSITTFNFQRVRLMPFGVQFYVCWHL